VTQRTTTTPVALDARKLAGDVVLLVWNSDDAPARGLRATIAGTLIPPPASHSAIPLGGGRIRNLMAVRVKDQTGPLAVCDSSGHTVAQSDTRSSARARPQDLDPAGLLVGLEGAARVRAVRFIADVCGSIFQLGGNADFIANCRQLIGEISRRPGTLVPRCKVLDRYVLCTGVAQPAMGERISAILVGPTGVRRTVHAPVVLRDLPVKQGLATFAVLLEKTTVGGTLVLLGENGLACRQIVDAVPAVSALDWLLGAAKDKAPLRGYLLDCLAKLADEDAHAASLLRELQVLGPDRGRASNREGCPVSAGADLMLATAAGLFASGWLRDPHHVVEKLEIQQADRAHAIALDELLRYPHREADLRRAIAASDVYSGFAVFLPAANRKDASCRLTLLLRSGERIAVAEGPTFLAPDAAIAALLGAIPVDSAPADAIAARIEPALAALRAQRPRGEPEIIDIGTLPDSPTVTLVVPLTAESDLVRCRMGLFATDPAMKQIEIVHVLDRAQKRAGAERLLRAMHTAYGVPTRLVVVDEAVESGAALNAAVKASRAPLLALIGAGVLPEQAGWLDALAQFMDAHPRCGAAGPRLMREDGSLASAGLEFAPDVEGRWDAKPLLRGFPCDFPPATAAAPVAGLAHGCTIIRRSLFDLVGGFAEAYLDRQRQSADLGARVSSHGFEIWRTATMPLFDFAVDKAVPGLAVELDRRALEQRWRNALTAEPVKTADTVEPDAEPKTRTRVRRRRRVA
jgi:hypothetical protein